MKLLQATPRASRRWPRVGWGVTLVALMLFCASCEDHQHPSGVSDRYVPASPPSPDRILRVLLADDEPQYLVTLEDSFDLTDTETGEVLAENVEPQSLSVVFWEEGMRFPRLELDVERESVDLEPHGLEPVEVNLPGGHRRRYGGGLRFVLRSDGTGGLINLVDMEEYLVGVIASELPNAFHEQTFRVQAIAARTFAWYEKQAKGPYRSWDVKATEGSQVYRGLERVQLVPKAPEAVRATEGVVCVWNSPEGERIFCTYYSSTCGGGTVPVDAVKREPRIPPLAGNIECTYCKFSPTFDWEDVRITKAEVTERLRQRYLKFESLGTIEQIQVKEQTALGRPVTLLISDARDESVSLEAENFRLSVDPGGRRLKSTWFDIVEEDDAFLFTNGHGFGHGLGMCQYGAEGQAREGRMASDILQYYYPQSLLRRAY